MQCHNIVNNRHNQSIEKTTESGAADAWWGRGGGVGQ